MQKNKRLLTLLLPIFIGLVFSIWSQYFIQNSYFIQDSSDWQTYCSSESGVSAVACTMPDYEEWGAPLSFKKADWVYPQGVSSEPGTEALIEYSFSIPLFIFNILLIAAPFYALLAIIATIQSKKSTKAIKK